MDHLLNRSIEVQFTAFYHGFHTVCDSKAIDVRNLLDYVLGIPFNQLAVSVPTTGKTKRAVHINVGNEEIVGGNILKGYQRTRKSFALE